MEKLPSQSLQFLHLLAADKGRARSAVIKEALGLNHLEYMKTAGSLERIHRVIEFEDDVVRFSSTALQDTLYQRMAPDRSQHIHRTLGRALARVYAHDDAPVVEAIATHAAMGGDRELAFSRSVAAAVRAEALFDHGRAAGWYERALEQATGASERLSVLKSLGAANIRRKRWDRAESVYHELLDLGRLGSNRVEEASALRGLGLIRTRRKRFDEAERHYQRSLEIWKELGDVDALCDILIKLGRIYLEQGKWPELDRAHAEAFRRVRQSGNRSQLADLLMNTAIRHNIQGDTDRALKAYRQCLEIYRDRRLWER